MERKVIKKNYREQIDRQTRIVSKKINEMFRGIDKTNIPELRKINEKVCDTMRSGKRSRELNVTNDLIKLNDRTIRIRTYMFKRDSHAQILYIHGGGFIMGGIESDDDICSDICQSSGFNVTAVEYRLSPEHKHPAALDDVRACYNYLKTKGSIIILGHSAGATLAAIMAHELMAKGESLIGQVLICPFLGGNLNTGSYIEHAQTPFLSTDDIRYYLSLWLKEGYDLRFLPLSIKFSNFLLPTAVFTADLDPLRDDGFAYVSRLLDQKTPVSHTNAEGLFHSFLRIRHISAKAMCVYQKLIREIIRLGNKEFTPSLKN
ncbi:MAG: alpha/beta hydrolase [Pseudomonadota bacterium]|nr:alpha/beta hydrolase [Pseudomonadota bacterium]